MTDALSNQVYNLLNTIATCKVFDDKDCYAQLIAITDDNQNKKWLSYRRVRSYDLQNEIKVQIKDVDKYLRMRNSLTTRLTYDHSAVRKLQMRFELIDNHGFHYR